MLETQGSRASKRRNADPSGNINAPNKNLTRQQSSTAKAVLSPKQKLRIFRIRALWSIILILLFVGILSAGHFYTAFLVLTLTVLVYHEIIALKQNVHKDKKLPLFFCLRWYFFFVTVYATGSFWIIPCANKSGFLNDSWRATLDTNHFMITYVCGLLGLMFFLMSLHKFTLRYQFSQFALLIMTCFFVVGQAMFQIKNINAGIAWFIISSTAVIVNDVSAYVCGTLFGRTRLLNLSPNKTIEGFIGASWITILWTVILSRILFSFQIFICPVETIYFQPFSVWKDLNCDIHPAFVPQDYLLQSFIGNAIGIKSIKLQPAWLHSFVLGAFAAFVAPLGGFFASAVKRSLKIKDFGDSIPGHGGITDRFDCQLIMGMFTHLYLRTFIFTKQRVPSLTTIVKLIHTLSDVDQLALFGMLNQSLTSQAINAAGSV